MDFGKAIQLVKEGKKYKEMVGMEKVNILN